MGATMEVMMDDNDHRGSNIVILVSTFTTLSTLTTILRLFVRSINHHAGWDDLTIGLAVGFSIISWPFYILAVDAGYGRHQASLPKIQVQAVLKWVWFIEFLLSLSLPLTKMSVCFFILRIKSNGWLKTFLWIIMLGLVLTSLLQLLILCTQCQPLSAYWNRDLGTCWNSNIYNVSICIGVGKRLPIDRIPIFFV